MKASFRVLILMLLYTFRAIQSLNQNTAVNLEAHIQQLLPAVFTCIVAGKLSSSHEEVLTILFTDNRKCFLSKNYGIIGSLDAATICFRNYCKFMQQVHVRSRKYYLLHSNVSSRLFFF